MNDSSTVKNFLVPQEEILKQQEFAQLVHSLISLKYSDRQPLAMVHTYGCQGNVADGERIKGILEKCGYAFTDDVSEADLVLYNTCAIREHAEDRIYGNVGALKNVKKANPDMIIALCGCMMQQEKVAERIRKSYPYVNLLFGTHVIHKLPELLYNVLRSGKRVFMNPDSDGVIAENVPVHRDGTVKGWLPIMYGCNNFCSYCIVP